MYRRSPLGNPLVWLVACLVLPEVVKRCKPLAKIVGDTLVSAGETFRKAADEPAPEAKAKAEPAPEAESEPAPAKSKKSKASSHEAPADEPKPAA